ncbi:TIGR01244 family sulfur transferase [Aurantiacibacter spongiae]|uniref:TIGR01244 family phosphatase n=1 Tax=Aurantiacibacter spongiae TaxID=2488860 RepID=A0A3N5CRP4_9SPHN|nr:TIGR01244 family sulfur transferase [Aurantiacibacter spongiae]RPF71277.1 TIGR01244 family phosphatase [Aurantiacibacter spongiae]
MSDFRRLTDQVWASPQITLDDVAEARERGFAMIVNNRPDGEVEDQPEGDAIEAAARAAGLDYRAIPVGHAGFSGPQVDAMAEALAAADGKVLAYCRSGTRSTLLWALARAQQGEDTDTIARAAAEAGYDIAPVRQAIMALSARAGE